MPISELLESIADGFAKIEVQDRKVNKVFLPPEYWGNLLHDCRTRDVFSPNYFSHQLHRGHLGSLWGAELYIHRSNEAIRVVSDEAGYYPLSFDFKNSWILSKTISGLTIIVKTRASYLDSYSKEEWKAMETLREMISESDFRKYIKYGFILVRSATGDVYQIFRDKSHTKIWRNGKVVEEVCVRISDQSCPDTDNVIAFKTLIETDEKAFKSLGNVYRFNNEGTDASRDPEPAQRAA